MSSRRADIVAPPAGAGQVPLWTSLQGLPRQQRVRIEGYAGYLVVLTLLFVQPLTRLIVYAAHSELQSYILLVPLITGWLLYLNRGRYPEAGPTSIPGAIALGAIGVAALAGRVAWRGTLGLDDELALMSVAFVSCVAAGGFLFLGSKWMAAAAFPITFLIFMTPLPDPAVNWFENVLMVASADAADLLFRATGTPHVRDGTVFELPGIVLRVAQECSGIHSTWVLFLTSLVGSQLFLRTTWRRIALVAFVIPLGIVRNGFRILIIGLLCIHVGRHMIDSPIHHRGGPLFFALSLIPLFLLLYWLRRQEQRPEPAR